MPDSPNLLVLITDQQRYDTLACYGNEWIQAPCLNALSDESFVFENAYVAQPVCTPARSTMLTGLYPHTTGQIRNGIPMRTETPSIGEMLSDNYRKAYFGKWHLGDDNSPQHGFSEWFPVGKGDDDADISPSYQKFLKDAGVELPPLIVRPGGDGAGSKRAVAQANLPENLTQAAWVAGEASEFLRTHDSGPFTLFVNFFEPHPPYSGPLGNTYDPEEIPVGPAFLEYPAGASLFNRSRSEFYMAGELPEDSVGGCDGHDLHTESGWRSLRAQYMANITLVDRQIARMLTALKESGHADDTIIVVTSDHGDMLGDHGLLEKRAFYEESARVPLLVHVPWLSEQSRKITGSIGHIDLVPTLLDLMGQPIPDHLQGDSRVAVLTGEATLDGNEVFVQWNGQGDRDLGSDTINDMVAIPRRAIVTSDRWKLIICEGDGGELFDLNTDPFEMVNLYFEPDHQERVRRLTKRLHDWQERVDDTVPLPS